MLYEMSDEELVDRYRAGDLAALVVLNARHHVPLTNHGVRRGLTKEDSTSLAHIVLIEAATRFDASRHSCFKDFLWLTWGRRMQDEFRKGPGGLTGFRTADGTDVDALQEARAGLSGDAELVNSPAGTDPADVVASDHWIVWMNARMKKAILDGPNPRRQLEVWTQTLRRWSGLPYLSDAEIADKFGCHKSTVSRDRSFLADLYRELLAEEQDSSDDDDPKEDPQ